MNGVIRVIKNGVEIIGLAADLAERRIGDIYWVAERPIVDRVIKSADTLTSEKVVQRPVLHGNEDDIFNLLLQVFD